MDAPPDPRDKALEAAIRSGVRETTPRVDRPDHDPLFTVPEAISDALPAWRYTADMTTSYVGDDGTEESWLREKVVVTHAQDGRFKLTVRRSHRRVDDPAGETGREGIFDGKRFYTRPLHGDWTARDLLRRDHLRWRREAMRHLEVLLSLPGKAAVRTTDGRLTTLSLGPWLPPGLPAGTTLERLATADGGPEWYRWWANVHTPTRLDGRISLHERTNIVESAQLTLAANTRALRVPREDTAGPEPAAGPRLFGKTAESLRAEAEARADAPEAEDKGQRGVPASARFLVELTVALAVIEPGEPLDIIAPTESVSDGRRPRVHHMIDMILGGKTR